MTLSRRLTADTDPVEAGWIECPRCEGSGGWHGCYDCGESVAGDSTEYEERGRPGRCARCQKVEDCRADGGHQFGPITVEDVTPIYSRRRREAVRYVRSCACGAAIQVKAYWSGSERGYVEVQDGA